MVKKYLYLLLPVVFIGLRLHAQQDSSLVLPDTLHHVMKDTLREVTIRAYEQERRLIETPASIGVINQKQLSEYSNTNILPAVNTVPGVRMEERSPGSYRFSIRGSTLESPFGVRNVKVYYNDIPYTEAGGNTYLNQLGFYNFQSLEVIKGPGSSIYGAGTGGVLLINSMEPNWQPGVRVDYTAGSYNLNSAAAEVRLGDSAFKNSIRYQHITSDGYRQQTNMRKDVLSWDATMQHRHGVELSAHFLYGDLYYQTPGALTLNEFNADPQQARPGTATAPGAVDSKAAIYQKTILAGFTYKQQYSQHWANSTTLFGDYATQLNPNTRNYSRTSEPNFGGRTTFKFNTNAGKARIQWIAGGELVQGLTQNRVYKNVGGNPQNLQTDQEINNMQLFGFTQLSCTINKWQFTGGVSVNKMQTQLATISALPYTEQNKVFANQLAPRLAILRRLNENISLYGTVSKGFSPPTIDELAPTGSLVNFNLEAEQGWNYELGTHGSVFKNRFSFDVNFFYFQLQNSIVQRRDSSGGDFYLNAGSAIQAGLEASVNYELIKNADGFIRTCSIYTSYTANAFHYDQFVQAAGDYSGKQMPGSAPNTIASGFHLATKPGLYVNITNYYSDKIPLNDANTAYGNAYDIPGGRVGYKREYKKYSIDIYAGADNILNQTYSLGNDINAVGGRYYNAAPGINYFVGLMLGWGGEASRRQAKSHG